MTRKQTKHKIYCRVMDRRGMVLAQTENSYTKTHPLMGYFAQKVGLPEKTFLHAEVLGLLQTRGKTPDAVEVTRYARDGTLALAKPCKVCQEALKAFGVRMVRYSTPGGYHEENVEDF